MYIHLGGIYVEVTYSFGGQRTGIESAKAEEAVLGCSWTCKKMRRRSGGRWRTLNVKEKYREWGRRGRNIPTKKIEECRCGSTSFHPTVVEQPSTGPSATPWQQGDFTTKSCGTVTAACLGWRSRCREDGGDEK